MPILKEIKTLSVDGDKFEVSGITESDYEVSDLKIEKAGVNFPHLLKYPINKIMQPIICPRPFTPDWFNWSGYKDGSPVAIATSPSGNASDYAVITLSSTVLAFYLIEDSVPKIKIGLINGTVVTPAGEVNLPASTGYYSFIPLAGNTLLIGYGAPDTTKNVVLLTVTAGNPALGTPQDIPELGADPEVDTVSVKLSANKIFMTCSSKVDGGPMTAVRLNIAGSVITPDAGVTLIAGNITEPIMTALSDSSVAIKYIDSSPGSVNKIFRANIAIDGTITKDATQNITDYGDTWLSAIDASNIFMVSSKSAQQVKARVVNVDVAGVFTFNSEVDFFSGKVNPGSPNQGLCKVDDETQVFNFNDLVGTKLYGIGFSISGNTVAVGNLVQVISGLNTAYAACNALISPTQIIATDTYSNDTVAVGIIQSLV